jgi:hypothetical protein
MKVLSDKIIEKMCRNYIMKFYFTLTPASAGTTVHIIFEDTLTTFYMPHNLN